MQSPTSKSLHSMVKHHDATHHTVPLPPTVPSPVVTCYASIMKAARHVQLAEHHCAAPVSPSLLRLHTTNAAPSSHLSPAAAIRAPIQTMPHVPATTGQVSAHWAKAMTVTHQGLSDPSNVSCLSSILLSAITLLNPYLVVSSLLKIKCRDPDSAPNSNELGCPSSIC